MGKPARTLGRTGCADVNLWQQHFLPSHIKEIVVAETPSALNCQVPEFSAPMTGGNTFQLSNFAGKNIVLYFYPKDNTPGCTTEGIAFRDLHPRFSAANTEIFGISRDSLRSHEGFKTKLALPFDLISDPDETLCQLFNVMKMKNMYGKQVRGIERSTFLIDAKGKLVKEWRGVKVAGHVDEVLEFVSAQT
ncbi:peroxiredoxin [Undibacterium oligocarboniphilum]|uniref:thioredoxin-dependent peroxiredoxin n=1 Tax=Undibacterium oligocarboniphilum TaxID=666702 RepID=A0A850Q8P3_9BURK|nr:peroxiredoxin [Undibacterium oligocarboniphilum]NVO76642.1 peroxiredoxin [Undibacterium oligocarboniphilum]